MNPFAKMGESRESASFGNDIEPLHCVICVFDHVC